ncbi:ATP-binding protein [Verrucomicrobiota bacterium]
MKDISLHILDVAENSIRAEAKLVEIRIIVDAEKEIMTLEIKDDGHGMDPEMAERAVDPFFTTKDSRRVGLGLALLAQAARETEGSFDMSSRPGEGTRVLAEFRYKHPDSKPLGDISSSLQTLVAGNPDVDFVFEQSNGDETINFDTRQMRRS